MFNTIFENLGLSDKEGEVYLSFLKLGSAPASSVCKMANIPRTTAKYTCEQLAKKGLLLAIDKGNTTFYTPENPEKLNYLLNEKKNLLIETENQLNRKMSELKAMINPYTALPKVQFFEGKEGIASVYDKILENLKLGDEILSYVEPLEDQNDNFGIKDIVYNFAQKRVAKNIKIRIIIPKCEIAYQLRQNDTSNFRETKIVQMNNYQFGAGENFIYKDKICHISGKDFLFAYLVQNENIAQMNRALFEIAWKQAKIENDDIIA